MGIIIIELWWQYYVTRDSSSDSINVKVLPTQLLYTKGLFSNVYGFVKVFPVEQQKIKIETMCIPKTIIYK